MGGMLGLPISAWSKPGAVTRAVSCCDSVKPFLIQDRLSYQTVRFISLKQRKTVPSSACLCFLGQLERIFLSTQTQNTARLGEGEVGSLPGLGGAHGRNQCASGNSGAQGFLLSNQTHCANHLDNLIWVSFILKWEQEADLWPKSLVQAFFGLNMCICGLHRCLYVLYGCVSSDIASSAGNFFSWLCLT